MRTISDDERRARLARRHGLAAGARFTDPVMLTGALGGLHATDPATVFLAARARLAQPTGLVKRALAQLAVASETEGVRAWIGEARIAPRFRTPLERELSARTP